MSDQGSYSEVFGVIEGGNRDGQSWSARVEEVDIPAVGVQNDQAFIENLKAHLRDKDLDLLFNRELQG